MLLVLADENPRPYVWVVPVSSNYSFYRPDLLRALYSSWNVLLGFVVLAVDFIDCPRNDVRPKVEVDISSPKFLH